MTPARPTQVVAAATEAADLLSELCPGQLDPSTDDGSTLIGSTVEWALRGQKVPADAGTVQALVPLVVRLAWGRR